MNAEIEIKPEKPVHLKKGRRAFIKRKGKELLRKIASYQSKQPRVPDTPKIANEHFDFLDNFTDNWKAISEEAKEVLKFRDTVPGFEDISPDQYGLAQEKKWAYTGKKERRIIHAEKGAAKLS